MSQQRVAGRELDAEIAEHVMGFRWWRSSGTGRRCLYRDQPPHWFHEESADKTEPLVGDWPECVRYSLPYYSADIAAAWAVVERMRADKYALLFESDAPPERDFIARFERDPSGLAKYEHAATAPLAICLAALAAMPDKPTGTADADEPVPHKQTLTNSVLVSHHREDEPR